MVKLNPLTGKASDITKEDAKRFLDNNKGAYVVSGQMDTYEKAKDNLKKTAESLQKEANNVIQQGARKKAIDTGFESIQPDESDEKQKTNTINASYQKVAGIFDHASGSVDESIGRQFDDEKGGGFADETGKAVNNTVINPLNQVKNWIEKYWDLVVLVGAGIGALYALTLLKPVLSLIGSSQKS